MILSISENGFGKRTPVNEYRRDGSWREGCDADEDHTENRQGDERALGERGHGARHHHPKRQDDPHRFEHDSTGRTFHAGRQARHVWKKAIALPQPPASPIPKRTKVRTAGRTDSIILKLWGTAQSVPFFKKSSNSFSKISGFSR